MGIFQNILGAEFVIVKGMAPISYGKTDLARYLAIENAKVLALETARGVIIQQKTVSDNSLVVYSQTKSQITGRILKYSLLREWTDSNNYWVEIGALVSDKDEAPDFSITLTSNDAMLKNLALDVFEREGFIILKEPQGFFPKLTLSSTITEKRDYEFYGKKFFYTRVLLNAELENVDGSRYEFGRFGEASNFSYNMAMKTCIEETLEDLSREIKRILDNPKKLYLRIKNATGNTDEVEKLLDLLDKLTSTVKIEHFGKNGDLLCILEISDDPLIFLSRIVKNFERKIDLTWKNGIYELDLSGGVRS